MSLALVGRGRSTRSAMGGGCKAPFFWRVEGERNRRSSSGQRFAPPPSAADCPAEDHRSLSLLTVRGAKHRPPGLGGGFGG